MTFYHYTDAAGHDRIAADGFVRPGADVGREWPQSMFVWFTDLTAPTPDALGLPDEFTTHRVEVDSPKVLPWSRVRDVLPGTFVTSLEETTGGQPEHWFLAAEPIPVLTS